MIVSGPVVKLKSTQVHKRSPKTIKTKGQIKIPRVVPVDYESGYFFLMKGIRLFFCLSFLHLIIESTIKKTFHFFQIVFSCHHFIPLLLKETE